MINDNWININDELPEIGLDNLSTGSKKIKVKHYDGTVNYTTIYEPNIWKEIAIKEGITHWLKNE